MHAITNTRRVLSLWMILSLTVLAAASPAPAPAPAPEPAPIDPALASIITSNLNLGCVHGCPAADSARQAVGSSPRFRPGGHLRDVFRCCILEGVRGDKLTVSLLTYWTL
ncbi:hypothetical protein BV22DRAFT_188418 [Leucogyrophana mollusca]|uniref:Uncharacterized protein n=1 Tax=Leucogyrophana mollusca TaxID=85980 RepID=A0ACB8BRZ6_9AGAM|nr:hypothetical protein BV22DRAFT_188418 [Leucogyrophana mollusca]